MFGRTRASKSLPIRTVAGAMAIGGCLAFTGPAMADEQRYETYDGSPVASAEQLRAMRGGLQIAGLDLSFGATVRTFVNGTLAAETVFTLNDAGGMDRQTTIMNGAALTPVSGEAAISTDNLNLPALAGASGFVINDPSGSAAALTNITLQHAQNIVINTVPGLDLQQLVDMSLTIQNFAQLHSDLQAAALAGRIAQIGQIEPMLHPTN
jgi:hypothetical protein